MTHTELEQVIRDYYRDQFQVEFIGRIRVEDLDPVGYKVSLNLDHSENPVVYIADLPDEEFIPFIKEELRRSKLHEVEFFKAIKIQPPKPTLCYDRERAIRQDQRHYL